MTRSAATTNVAAPADDLFAYLSEASNLPEYFPMMTSARSVDDGGAVHTTAVLDDGSKVEGEAWFEVDQDGRSIKWGSEGDHDYRGELTVTGEGESSEVEISIHTTRESADDDLDSSLRDVLRTIRSIVESSTN